MSQQLSGQEFHLGLAMAGAVSAGAYSSGVFDFLVQALDEWERARRDPQQQDRIPNHRVGLKALSGASAGAITGAIGAVALADGVKPEPFAAAQPGMQPYRRVLPRLYEAWVLRPALAAAEGRDLLATDDLSTNREVRSLLNSGLLDRIRDAALEPLAAAPQPLDYVAQKLHLYLTVSNLRGIEYQVRFTGGDYGMVSHGDRAHFALAGLGAWATQSPWADDDPAQALDLQRLTDPGYAAQLRGSLGEAALASGAFPGGLAARRLQAMVADYDGRKWPVADDSVRNVMPHWSEAWGTPTDRSRSYSFLNVDGGMINNEPFEYARYSIMRQPPLRNPREGEHADRAVIMIDPFPEAPTMRAENEPDDGLVGVILALLPTLINQGRFKPAELAAAGNDGIYSRYLVAPHRHFTGRPQEETHALACGLVHGFGGFLSQKFRDHDFQLARRNCQWFLRQTFSLPPQNPLVQAWSAAARQDPRFVTRGRAGGPAEHCIVPLLGSAALEVPMPEWPRMSAAELQEVERRIGQRLAVLGPRLVKTSTPGGPVRWGMRLLLLIGNGRIMGFIRQTLLSELIRRDQLEGWALPAGLPEPAARQVLAELAAPGDELRSEAGIARETGLEAAAVRSLLEALMQQRGKPYEVWRAGWKDGDGRALYALASRKPPLLQRLPGLRPGSA